MPKTIRRLTVDVWHAHFNAFFSLSHAVGGHVIDIINAPKHNRLFGYRKAHVLLYINEKKTKQETPKRLSRDFRTNLKHFKSTPNNIFMHLNVIVYQLHFYTANFMAHFVYYWQKNGR